MTRDDLVSEFEKLSYEKIKKILDILGIRFASSINSISKAELYAIAEYDCGEDKVKEAMKIVKEK